MSFVGFNITRTGDLLDPQTKQVVERMIMNPFLMKGLEKQGVNLNCNYEDWPRLV